METIKGAETIEEIENVSADELAEVEATLQSDNPSKAEQLTNQTLAAQTKLRTLAEIIADLSKPLPNRHLKKLTKGAAAGSTYIPWPIAVKYMDFKAPGWESHIQVSDSEYGSTIVTAITVPTADFGKVTRSDVGFEPHVTNRGAANEKLTGFGGASPIASRQSFKRAAALGWGLGRYLYDK